MLGRHGSPKRPLLFHISVLNGIHMWQNPSSRIGPYYVAAATCLNSADGEMKTAKSIPQIFALRFLHSSDPSRKILVWVQVACSLN